jgi:glycosyltransferase involved in cell wall biosynthesis
MSISVIVCAYNEEAYVAACLEMIRQQRRAPDEIILVDNASTDRTGAIARGIPGVTVVEEPRKGLVRARQRGLDASRGSVVVYTDADCLPPVHWLERIEARLGAHPDAVAITGTFRYYDWDRLSCAMARLYDFTLAPATQILVRDVLGLGAVLYGGNFAVRRQALLAIGGFDTSIEFHGEDTNLGRRLSRLGRVLLSDRCWVYTSARRFRAMGRMQVARLYIRNFTHEILYHEPADALHVDIRG